MNGPLTLSPTGLGGFGFVGSNGASNRNSGSGSGLEVVGSNCGLSAAPSARERAWSARTTKDLRPPSRFGAFSWVFCFEFLVFDSDSLESVLTGSGHRQRHCISNYPRPLWQPLQRDPAYRRCHNKPCNINFHRSSNHSNSSRTCSRLMARRRQIYLPSLNFPLSEQSAARAPTLLTWRQCHPPRPRIALIGFRALPNPDRALECTCQQLVTDPHDVDLQVLEVHCASMTVPILVWLNLPQTSQYNPQYLYLYFPHLLTNARNVAAISPPLSRSKRSASRGAICRHIFCRECAYIFLNPRVPVKLLLRNVI